jgi:integrase
VTLLPIGSGPAYTPSLRGCSRKASGSPKATLSHKRDEKSRDRVLSLPELKAIWDACRDDDYGDILRLLILTGQRANEIAALRWDEVHDEMIVLPGERTKNHRAHVVPLSDAAKALLEKRDRDRAFVFGRDDTGWQGWGAAKHRIEARIGAAIAERWTPHDIRRSVVTHMAERVGVLPHIIEAVVNHQSGHKGGIAGVYNKSTYDREKREALNLWAEHLLAFIEGRDAAVVPLKRA